MQPLEIIGQVISIVADSLEKQSQRTNVLYLSEDGYNLPFSTPRALSRNRLIHCMGIRTFVAQSGYQRGGTWDGTVKNLRFGWSTVYCFEDGSPAQSLLQEMGANAVTMEELSNISDLKNRNISLF